MPHRVLDDDAHFPAEDLENQMDLLKKVFKAEKLFLKTEELLLKILYVFW
jgi:hypothetical protein